MMSKRWRLPSTLMLAILHDVVWFTKQAGGWQMRGRKGETGSAQEMAVYGYPWLIVKEDEVKLHYIY